MKARRPSPLLIVLALFGAGFAWRQPASAQPAPLPLKAVKDVPIGAPTRRFDYASLDPRTGLLFVADLAGSRVLAFDVRELRLVGVIAGVQSVHGVLAVPELGRVYASATGVDQLVAIDEASLKIVSHAPAGHYPDGIAWDPKHKKLCVSDETGRTVAVVDAASNQLVQTLQAGGEAGNTQYDAGSAMIYSNEQTNNRLIGIDPKTDRIVSRDSLPGCEGAHGLLIDATRRLAFIACEDNAKLITFSLARHAKVAEASIGAGPDVLAYDGPKRWLYVSSESGVVSIFEVGNDATRKIGQALLADNAHVVAVDPASHRAFFPLRDVGGRSVLRVTEPR
jgi:hypothetical protein